MQTPKKIGITGSGLVGSLLAIYLRKLGHQVDVYDRRPDIRTVEFSGRSINLAVSHRGWKALEEVGIREEIEALAIAMDKRAIHVTGKEVYYQYYGKDGEAIYSISRGVLNKKMIDLAEEAGTNFVFNSKVWDVSLSEGILYTGNSEKESWKPQSYDLIFGADGAFSRIRHKMQRSSMFNYSQHFLKTAYKELSIPAAEGNLHKMDKNSLHIWPRGEFMLIALPNLDGSFTCTLFMPYEGENSFQNLDTKQKVQGFFRKHFEDVIDDIPNLISDFFKNPTSSLVTIKCEPWTSYDKVALIGDAAHAIVPFYGQGMNVGFEDITVLNDLIRSHGDDWKTIFEQYQTLRKPNTDAIAELSYRNFMEMSSKTADEKFLLRKKIENKFSEKYPDKWMPLYSRVTFSTDSYAEALRRGDIQKEIMDRIMEMDSIEQLWDSELIETRILQQIEEVFPS